MFAELHKKELTNCAVFAKIEKLARLKNGGLIMQKMKRAIAWILVSLTLLSLVAVGALAADAAQEGAAQPAVFQS